MKTLIIYTLVITLITYYYSTIVKVTQKSIVNYYYPLDTQHQDIIWAETTKKTKKKHPNIILIITDDLGVNDLHESPNINSIYQNGVKFNKAYATQATCAPSRASIYSGRFPTKLGLEFTPHPFSLDLMMHMQSGQIRDTILNYSNALNIPSMEYLHLNNSETLISNILHEHKYSNYFIGKWHLGETNGFRPRERGYDESLSFLQGASMYKDKDDDDIVGVEIENSVYDAYMNNLLPFAISHNNKKYFKPREYMTDYLSNNAIDVIKHSNDTSPFFITLAYNAPHSPFQALREDYNVQTGTRRERVYKAMIRAVDRGVGNIIETLKKEGKYDDTLIIFTSDNGGASLIGKGDINYPFSGWKCTFFEGGIRVPMFWQWPNKIPKGILYDKTVSHVDIFSTIQSIVDHDEPNRDGVDLIPYILNEVKYEPHEMLFWRSADYRLLKLNEWKLSILDTTNKAWFFNIADDIQEKNNLLSLINFNQTIKNKYEEMLKLINKINGEQKSPLWNSPIMTAIPIYGPNLTSLDDEFVYWAI